MTEIHIKKEGKFSEIPIDYTWSFADKTSKDTSYATHGYYTYPAKFIPQLASRLINEYSQPNDIVVDPFMGSATTIVEALINKRVGIGVDINEIAYLIGLVKTTPISSDLLLTEFNKLYFDLVTGMSGKYDSLLEKALKSIPQNKKIDYWFLPEQRERLAIIFARILEIKQDEVKNFFLVSFAQILKSCSIWLQKSIKPTRDMNKKIRDPLVLFLDQSKKMIEKHLEFDQLLSPEVKHNIFKYRFLECTDSRNLPCKTGFADLIVTSPPYVTSYEYADLHQLPALWFGYLSELSEFRMKFIGSAYKNKQELEVNSLIADKIIRKLTDSKKAKEVKNYFSDMFESFLEMKRVIKRKGKLCIVIGNTEFKGVEILNAEVFQEQLESIGFKTHKIIHREIPSKILPSTRDSKTGQFVKVDSKNLKLAYPTEYILIMEKYDI